MGFIEYFYKPRLGDASYKVAAGGTPAAAATLELFWLCFLDEHHRDIVDDRVEHLAVGAAQLIRLLELDLGVALWAGQDFEQLV